jgi:hypothetical protein
MGLSPNELYAEKPSDDIGDFGTRGAEQRRVAIMAAITANQATPNAGRQLAGETENVIPRSTRETLLAAIRQFFKDNLLRE